jgi:predicted nucleic acid-binding protein
LILVDTNILVRYARTTDADFATVDAAVTTLHANGDLLCVVPQNVYEFWAVATRPAAANGLGLSITECTSEVALIKRLFRLLQDMPGLFNEWERLVETYSCHGRVSFDARLVAAMRTHGVTRLLTFNTAHFARFPGVTILDPAVIPAVPSSPPGTTP